MAAALPYVLAGLSAISTISQANQTAAAERHNAEVADRNAQISELNRQSALASANANEEAQRRKARAALGDQRGALAQAGIGLDGSAADVYEQSAENAELDALNIRYQGALQANGFLNEANGYRDAAEQHRANASNAKSGMWLRAGASALSSFATSSGYLGGGLLSSQAPAPVSNAYIRTLS